ncbi:hypothetical protein GCM10023200_02780 [Actinomycetospora chlora]|uniref:Uncharacterized protein n=1 Tax=Actinomycetospora chlora TaxID=663608 RepID=A0ABP9A4C1_9PSEU
MRVLESPITWIVVAAVLLALALLLIVVSGVRRRRARRAAAAAAWPPPALEAGRADPEAVWTEPAPERDGSRTPVSNLPDTPAPTAAASYAEPRTDPLDVDAVRAGLTEEQPETTGTPERPADHRPRHAATDTDGAPEPEPEETVPDATPAPTPATATGTGDDGTDARTDAAKDRLLAVLLRDPEAAVAALAAAGDGGAAPGERDVTALLRAGLTPSQVAHLVGIDEERLATVVARGLGLLPGPQGPDGAATGENRTDEPGRSWANAASSAGSTTPTTG